MTQMINDEKLHVMEGFPPHSQIQSESSSTSTAPPPSTAFVAEMTDSAPVKLESIGLTSTGPNTSPGPGFVRPESRSRKRKPTRFLPTSQQDVMVPQSSPPGSTSKAHFDPTVEAMKAKYGDIDKGCILKAGFMKEMALFGIGCMFRALKKKKMDELEIGSLEPFYKVVRDAETVLKIDVKWMRQRLDEIREAIISNKEAKLMIVQRNICMKRVEQNKEKLKRLKTQIETLAKQMDVDRFKVKHLDKNINALTAKFQHFQQTSLTEGLL